MEKIIEIKESEFKIGSQMNYSGFDIITNKQVVRLGITMEPDCCEEPGYFMSEDDFKQFIGAAFLGISITDTCLKTKNLPLHGLDEGDAMFVNIDTSEGLLQFTAYNAHNGYYGHNAVVVSEHLNHECVL